ncbi:helix-turn-helix domain-containing protein [Pseudomonas putida]|uniref:helix-turn-helix domain-containing protein n=1 Tax=Pseudomonas putida TaxID=303 RepID=UPI00274FBB73|nr:helix-turn-helix domain-containing protein [Pseudomonas putida]MDP9524527.1 helix-turn-helix domain-containing protein [Pseudomonas putida]
MSAAINQQLSLFGGSEEAKLYHAADSRSYVAICTQDSAGKFHQWCVKPGALAGHLAFLEPADDMNVWISQGEFSRPNRRIVNLTRMGVCFLDLDTYKCAAKSWTREQVLAKIQSLCAAAGIPPPSLVIFSGQGYQIKWLLSSYLPREALVRWNVVQEQLVKLFEPLGADPAAKDAARILRLVGTTNLKSGKRVEVVYAQSSPHGSPAAVDFELLAKLLLPLDRQRKSAKSTNAKATDNTPFELVPNDSAGRKNSLLKGINTRVLAWDRLHDLRRLAELRGGIGEGMRNTYLLVVACQMALSGLIYPQNFRSEVRALQAEISNDPKWLKDRELLGSLQARVDAHYKREKIEYNGRELTPIYTYRTSTIISLLAITRPEQEQLKTLISSDLATERNTLRERNKRRAAGVLERAEYLEKHKQTAAERRAQILAMHAQGLTALQIAAHLDISKKTVERALK